MTNDDWGLVRARLRSCASFYAREPRIIEGIATTPTKNSHGYSVNPRGASYELPIPLIVRHDASFAVGWVLEAEAGPTRLSYRAQVANDGLPGLDEVWSEITSGHWCGVSAGFVDGTGARDKWAKSGAYEGRYIDRWIWDELSLCKVGANPDAKILSATEGGRLCQAFRPRSKVVWL